MTLAGGRGALLLLLALALAGSGRAAAEAVGQFTTTGDVSATGTVDSTLHPLGVFTFNKDGAARIYGPTGDTRLCIYELHVTEVNRGGVRLSTPQRREPPRCWNAPQARMESATNGNHSGWFGLDPHDGSTITRTGGEFSSDPRAAHTLSSARGVVLAGDDQPFFAKKMTGPLLYSEPTGTFSFRGGATLKLQGPDFWIVTATNRTRIDTGDTFTDTPTGRESVRRWAVVTFDAAALTITTTEPLEVAARSATLDLDGTLYLTPTDGTLNATFREYPSTGKPERITGRFTATLTPKAEDAATVALRGELQATSIAPRPAPVLGEPDGFPWGLAVAAVAVVTVAGTAFAVKLHRRTAQESHAEALVKLGRAALEDAAPRDGAPADYGPAIKHFREAAGLAPDMADAWMGLGYAHYHAEQYAEAIEAFTRARPLVETGEAELMVAMCYAALGAGEQASEWLLQALVARELEMKTLEKMGDSLKGKIDADPRLKAAHKAAVDRVLDGFGNHRNN